MKRLYVLLALSIGAILLPMYVKADNCDQTFYGTLRQGKQYTFKDDFSANGSDKWLRNRAWEYNEQYDYNNSADFPEFKWTDELKNNDYKVGKDQTMTVIRADKAYPIHSVPASRSYDNLLIKYTLTYSTDVAGNNKYAHTECKYYEISRCGDGVVDSSYGETCDPKDTNKTGWGNGGCDNSCKPINVDGPACNSNYNGQRLTSLTAGNHLCTEGTYSNFEYNESTHSWTWKCGNAAGTKDCYAIKPYCGDGTKDTGEACDYNDSTHAGWGDKGCSNSCQPINSYCGDGTKDAGEACDYNDPTHAGWGDKGCSNSCQPINSYCGDGTKDAGEACDYNDPTHAGWGDKGCSNSCQPINSYCGDGTKDAGEACDYNDPTHAGWGELGCSTSCQPIQPSGLCDETFYGTLRQGKQYTFKDDFSANGSDKWLRNRAWEYNEQYDYNNSADFPQFNWTDELKNNNYKVGKNQTMTVIKADKAYPIHSVPASRSYDNFFIKYTLTYSTDVAGNNKYAHTECKYYEISRCGDGVVDSSYGETCDPKDTSKTGWGNGGCDNLCQPITVTEPACNSSYNGQRLTSLVAGNHLCTEGTYSDFNDDDINHKWTWKCGNVAGVKKDCYAIKPYCGDGEKDVGEICDYNDTNKTGWGDKGCSNSCQPINSYCGDGTKDAGEACDYNDPTHAGWGDKGCSNSCQPINSYCGDGTKDAGEACDYNDPTHAGWGDKGCSNSCQPINSYCGDGTKDAGEACDYNDSTHAGWGDKGCSNLCQPINSYCGDGTKDAGEACDYNDPTHAGWGDKGCSNSCQPINSYCGDGTKDAGEACDYNDPTHAGWGELGCSTSCQPIQPSEGCDETFYRSLRYGHQYRFYDEFHANSSDKWLWNWKMEYNEQYDYNQSASFPSFAWTTELVNNGYKVAANTSMRVLQATSMYPILAVPAVRSYDNLFLKYILTYSTDSAGNNKYGHSECVYYEISRCGDGILDVDYDEICDPADPSHRGWGNGGCDNSCKPINVNGPVCNSTYNGQRLYDLTGGDYLCEEGTYSNFEYNESTHNWTWKCNNTAGEKTDCYAIKPYCGDGIKDEGEQCDPKDPNHTNWGNGGCDNSCQPITLENGVLKIEKTLEGKREVEKTGEILTWEVKVWAEGGDVTDFQIEDIVPFALEYKDYSVKRNDDNLTLSSKPIGPVKRETGNVYTWDVKGTLHKGNVLIIEVTTEVLMMPKSNDDYRNVACVIKNETKNCDDDKPNPTKGELKIEKTLEGKREVEKTGEILTWEVKVWAEGGDVTDFQIEDIVPFALEYKDYSVKRNDDNLTLSSKPIGPVKRETGNVYTWDVKGTLHKGNVLVIEVTTEVLMMPKSNDDYRNVACVIKDETKNCDDDKPNPTKGELDPLKTLISSKEIKNTGDLVIWSLKVTAKGGDVTDFEMWDALPPVLAYSGYEIIHKGSVDNITFGGEDKVNKKVTRYVKGTLKENDYVEIKLITYAKEMPDKDYNNVLCVKSETNPEKCDDEPLPAPKLWIKKSFTDGDDVKTKNVKIGDEIGYKIRFGNDGTASATITSIKDFLPKNVTYVSSEIYVNGNKIHSGNVVEGVYIDMFGGITLEPGSKGYIILTGKVLDSNQDSRVNLACIYLNDNKIECDDVIHNISTDISCKPTLSPSSFADVCPSEAGEFGTDITCSSTGGKADIEIICNGNTIKTGYDTKLTGRCNTTTHNADIKVQCKINGKTTGVNGEVCEGSFRRNTKSCGGGGSSCFIAGTKVTLADGREVNIEDVKKGDEVKGENGINVVKGYDRPVLGDRNLWSINGGEYFVSDEHPFKTTDGWKALDPEMAKIEIMNAIAQGRLIRDEQTEDLLNISKLEIGDTLISENGNERVVSLSSVASDANTQLYNLMLDGDNTYYANGYLVHNKGGGGGGGTSSPLCEKIKIDSDGVTCKSTNAKAYFKLLCDGKEYYSFDYKDGKNKDWEYTFNECKNPTSVSCAVSKDDDEDGTWKTNKDCRKIKAPSGSQQCFNVNAGNFSIQEGEIFPFYWNLFNMEEWVKLAEYNNLYTEIDGNYGKAKDKYEAQPSCDEDEEGKIAKDAMVCTFEIYAGGESSPLYTIQGPCLSKVDPLKESPLLNAWYKKMQSTYCNPGSNCKFSYGSHGGVLLPSAAYYVENLGSRTRVAMNVKGNWEIMGNYGKEREKSYGEYKLRLSNIQYLECNEGKWEQVDAKEDKDALFTPCESNFTLTNPYTVQKTPSGNLTASTEKLSKYKYLSGSKVFSELLGAISTTSYNKNATVEKAMDDFIKKYDKLAVKVDTKNFGNNVTVRKVPGKDIYFIDGNAIFKQSSSAIKNAFTIVQKDASQSIIIDGDLNNYNIMLLTNGNITFAGNCEADQEVKGIFYAGGSLIRGGVNRNDNPNNNYRCTNGGLRVKGVLIGDNFDGLMNSSRSHLNDWFQKSSDEEKRQSVMNGASVLIEYSPSIFTKSSMPPGAEYFTTALSIYKN